jgi:hypothetical protein
MVFITQCSRSRRFLTALYQHCTATRVGAPGRLYANPYMIVSLEDYFLGVYSKAYMREALFGAAFFGAVICDPPPFKASSCDAR